MKPIDLRTNDPVWVEWKNRKFGVFTAHLHQEAGRRTACGAATPSLGVFPARARTKKCTFCVHIEESQ